MKQKGFSLIEILIAIALAAIFVPAISKLFTLSLQSSSQGRAYSEAYTIAQEQMEAILYLKSQNDPTWDWINTPENNADSPPDYYQPQFTSGTWQLGTKTTTPAIRNGYTSTVTISPVHRCGDEICQDESAPIDPEADIGLFTKFITVTVSWLESGHPKQVELNSYVTSY